MSTTIGNSNAVSSELLDAVNAKTKKATDSVESDTNKFMTLLVTQLKNQDPLNPLDNAQITSQLAQLSTVTGVNKLNTTLESLKSSYQSSESLSAANMIGHGVLTKGNSVSLQNGQGILGVELASAADSVKVEVTNASGKVIHTVDLGAQEAGTLPLTWDGSTDGVDGAAGPAASSGKYFFKVTAIRGGETLKDANGLSFGTVASVSTSVKDGVKINVPGVGNISMGDVKQIL